MVGRHDEVDVAHTATVWLRVICRSGRTLQHGNGDACLAKLGEHAVLRHHEAIPARQVFPGARKVFRLVGRGEPKGFDGVCRIADGGLRFQLGPHGSPQTVRDGWNGERDRGWVICLRCGGSACNGGWAARLAIWRACRRAGKPGRGSFVARSVLKGAFGGDDSDRVFFGGGKLHGLILSLLRCGMRARGNCLRTWQSVARSSCAPII